MATRGLDIWPESMVDDVGSEMLYGRQLLTYSGRPRSIGEFFKRTVQRLPNKTALIDGDKEYTYGQLTNLCESMSSFLRQRFSVQQSDRVALLLGNQSEFVVSFLGISSFGAIPVPLNPRLSGKELVPMLRDSGAKGLIASESLLRKTGLLEECELSFIVIVRDAEQQSERFVAGGNTQWAEYTEVVNSTGSLRGQSLVHPTAPALILYTSGTTGKPKGVVITHDNVVHAVTSYHRTLALREDDSTAIAVPLFYVTGLIAQLLLMFYVGGTVVLVPKFKSERVLQLLADHHVTYFHAVATIFNLLLQVPDRNRYDLRSLRLVACGGGPVSPGTIRQMTEWLPCLDFRPVYGLTETSSPTSVYPDSHPLECPGSSGYPIPVVEIKVVAEDGQELPPGEVGEILVKGPVVVPGYWQNREKSEEVIRDGWLYTGDLGYISEAGHLFVLDRKKDMLIRGGEKIYSIEIENVLGMHPAVSEVAVVGVPDPVMGEEVMAAIVLRNGYEGRVVAEDIQTWVLERLAKYKAPRYVRFLKELPRNANGKVLKDRIRQWFVEVRDKE